MEIMEEILQRDVGAGVGDPSRRNFLKGVSVVGASALLPGGRLSAQTPADNARAIDCHHHFGTPAYGKFLAPKVGHRDPRFQPVAPRHPKKWGEEWSPTRDLEYMEQQGVSTAIVSNTVPGIWFGNPDETRILARELNEFGAKMMSDHKGRFGLWALLPLPNIDDSLREIEYAFDTLHADGVGIYTSYELHWLGDPIFRPVFDELNRRKAVVFVHPKDSFRENVLIPGLNEYLTETMRTIFSLLSTGAATRYGNIRFVFSHAGGTMPCMIERFGIAQPGAHNDVLAGPVEPNSRLYHLRRFYYDVANSCNTAQTQALKTILGTSQNIVYGSDWPMIESPLRQLQGLQTCGFSAAELRGIHRGNAERLLPRLS
jgi:predicted TIM-barrel fold metal-dependent hydrolase